MGFFGLFHTKFKSKKDDFTVINISSCVIENLKFSCDLMKIYFIYLTFGSLKEAKRLGLKLVKNKLAACTNIIPTIYSTYVWKKKTRIDKECSMIVKTSKTKVKSAIKFIAKEHSYSCPAVSAFPIQFTHPEFRKWIEKQTKH